MHTIGVSLILPVAIRICQIVHNNKIAELLKSIPLSNDTVSMRITLTADDVKSHLISCITCSDTFAIQIDESTDIMNHVQMMVFVRYEHERMIYEDFLLCKPIPKTTKG